MNIEKMRERAEESRKAREASKVRIDIEGYVLATDDFGGWTVTKGNNTRYYGRNPEAALSGLLNWGLSESGATSIVALAAHIEALKARLIHETTAYFQRTGGGQGNAA